MSRYGQLVRAPHQDFWLKQWVFFNQVLDKVEVSASPVPIAASLAECY